MRSFFKVFFASLLAIFIFALILFFVVAGAVSSLATKSKPEVPEKSILQIDLKQHFFEQSENDPVAQLTGDEKGAPGLYDVIRMIHHAKTDKSIAGIYIIADGNANGFASSAEILSALQEFKKSGKFIIAHGDQMTQSAYFVAAAADRIYLNPVGELDWTGFNVDLAFVKGTLDKLDIQPQIFYAGKYKSATEPFRATEMTEENKAQTTEWLNDLYHHFLVQTAISRKMDTATLHQLANSAAIQSAEDAFKNKLVDGLRYFDQIKDEFKRRLKIEKDDKLSLFPISKYADAVDFTASGKDKIAVIYAEGDIIDGEGGNNNIGGDKFRKIIRRARLDKSIKAIVLRVNSGGGSALASENIWRELSLIKKQKPFVVSFADVAASGGYYIGCGGDSIFASENTITGSIGVFTLLPNMERFFQNKLGITFDGVKTAEHADAGAVYRPLTEVEKRLVQSDVDRIYLRFKQRVADGRRKNMSNVDSIAQGRVWSGADALQLGLIDKVGGLQAAVECAARMAKTNNYRLREYPEKGSWLSRLFNKSESNDPAAKLKAQVGAENFMIFQELIRIKELSGTAQARLPFQ
ncbi:MAG TPA: signal peptide peptidase SppA, partial [Chitinophagaceae bacterium]|nr:signal peptide peptidase SppA [Chitinophagaceae bacterium]